MLTASFCVSELQEGDKANDKSSTEIRMDPRTVRSMEESRKLILEWASELNSVDMVRDSG